MAIGRFSRSEYTQIGPNMATRDIADLLFADHISAVPVMDGNGVRISMVSEGDLIARGKKERLAMGD